MIKRCWYLKLCFFIFITIFYFEVCATFAKQELTFFKDEAKENQKNKPQSFFFRNDRRKHRINGKKCIYKNNPKYLNNSYDDLVQITHPEKKSKQLEEMIDDNSFEKPDGCTREYRYLRLPNSLKVFMVYDKTTEISFGNMHLDFGFSSDPENIPGLSKYLLYTLLFGSLRSRFTKHFGLVIDKLEGSFGASINRDYSRYDFNIHSSKFEIALKIFANMFINLNTNDSVHEEILATLTNDLANNINLDSFRLSDILQEISSPAKTDKSSYDWNILEFMQLHHLDKFKSKNLLLEFFNQYYRADRMTLTILSNKTLDEQTSIVRKYFNKIRRGDSNIVTRLRLPDSEMRHPLYGSTGKILVFNSPQSSSFLKLIFPLNNISKIRFSSKPMFFFSMYISSKRKGSLYYHFYKHELVTEMKIYLSNSLFGHYSLIINISLQSLGEQSIIHIIKGIFSVFEMMRSNKPKLELYNRAKTLKMKKFKHRSNSFIFNECSDIQDAFNILKCPPEKVLSAPSTYTEYNLELHYKILSNLKPENMLLITTFNSKQPIYFSVPLNKYKGNTTEIIHKSNNDTRIISAIKANATLCKFYQKQLPIDNTQAFSFADCFNNLSSLTGFDYSILFEKSLNESEIITSNFTHTEYVIKKIHPFFISYLVKSVNSYTAINMFEISDPEYKFFRTREFKNYLVDVQKQDVPIRLIDAIRNLRSKRYNKIVSQDYLKDYQHIFYLPIHSINIPKSSISITIGLPPNLYSDNLSFPYSPRKLEVIFSIISFMLLRSFEDIKYYYKKLSISLNFSINTPTIFSLYTYGIIVELTGITDNLPHAISTIASRIKEFPSIVKDSDLIVAKDYYLKCIMSNNFEYLPVIQFQSILKILLFNQDLTTCSINNEIKGVKLHEIANAIDFLVKNGTFQGIIYGNINPIKARELLLLFFINLGRTSMEEKPFNKRSNIFLKLLSSVKKLLFSCFSYIQSFINKLNGKSIMQSETPEHLKSIPTQNVTRDTLRDFQVIDLLSFKEGTNFLYLEKSKFESFRLHTLVLKICFGYFTVEIESLVDILVEMMLKKYHNEVKREHNKIFTGIKRSTFSDGVVSIEIKIVSTNNLSELISYILKIYNNWVIHNPEVTHQNFILIKKLMIESLSNNSKNHSIIDFKKEIHLKRYQFNRKKEKIEFISQLGYSDFFIWLATQSKKVVKLLFVIYSPHSNEEEISKAINSVPPEFERVNSTDYFFKQPNTRSFNPSQLYNIK
ncbi:secreted insulinase like peptidase [Cryptosporidium sp. chipmunk genotype I]|uniref:secreted insulinase like peptidase n=1 Tax=Cryptosporidium sp. chipmunk genotype I TaxID=1280935 RepID=UPI00351A7B4A|nr:secreted insulinase like peptidase [Cryptosporidium sp. chipmunk genotype I]